MESAHKLWSVNADTASSPQFEKFNSKHSREYASLFSNLQKVMDLLNSGNKWGSFQIGFLRSEGGEVFRIGQTGVEHAKESRLYIYPDPSSCTMHILAIGTKDGQQGDVNEAKSSVKKIQKKAQN